MEEDKENYFDSKTISITLQKKILGKMLTSNKKVAKLFIDDRSSRLLDAFYIMCQKCMGGDKGKAEQLIKRIMKTCIKISVLGRNGKFNEREREAAQKFQGTFRTIVLTIISFAEVDYSYDKVHLATLVTQSREQIKEVIREHLTEKSLGRVDQIYDTLTDVNFMDAFFLAMNDNGPVEPWRDDDNKHHGARSDEQVGCGKEKPCFNRSKEAKILLEAFGVFADNNFS